VSREEPFAEADGVVAGALASRRFPGAILAVGDAAGVRHLRCFGALTYNPGDARVEPSTIYELASLTKAIATTTLAMVLEAEGRLDLRAPLSSLVPIFRGGDKDRVTVTDLLTHASGLPAWAPLFRTARGAGEVVAAAAALPLEAPPGARSCYSDLGFILLGAALEAAAGEGLEALAAARVLGPLGLGETRFNPGPEDLARIAPTEHDPWRDRVLRGEVHDENAFAMGGVAGHSGLFGPVGDVIRFARFMLGRGDLESRRLVAADAVDRYTRRCDVPGSSRALGWNTPSPGSSAGTRLSPRSFGHTGFTGTSLWIDPDRGVFVALLSNRVHPSRQGPGIQDVRAAVADAVVSAIDRGAGWP
jgi:CubicO group peptidase (beta-lactamase class C family)